jgi:pyruvate dehydrogenase E1 component alpha subunit
VIVSTPAVIDRETAIVLYGTMALIRRFEQQCYRGYEQGRVHGTVHVSIGQEAVAVGVMACLRPSDAVLSHHRGHGHAIAKGVDPARLMAELYGRHDGVSSGKGGSMHATSVEHGFLGTMAIVGSAIPLATGVALARKTLGKDDVCVAFFGDGAINQGILYESMNLAGVLGLPVIFVCENNGYAITTSSQGATAGPGMVARAKAFGLSAEVVDGQDVLAVIDATSRAVEGARSGQPWLLEMVTYRFMGHSRGDPPHGVYRSKAELAEWQARDPMLLLAEASDLSPEDIRILQEDARSIIDAAATFAEASPVPTPAELMIGIKA